MELAMICLVVSHLHPIRAISLLFVLLTFLSPCFSGSEQYVHNFEISDLSFLESGQAEKFSRQKRETSGETRNEQCEEREKEFIGDLKSLQLENKHVFHNETNWSISLAWAGAEGKTMIVITTKEQSIGPLKIVSGISRIYRSSDAGRSWKDIGHKVEPGDHLAIQKDNGLVRNKLDAKKVYIIAHGKAGSIFYTTRDGGANFHPGVQLSFVLDKDIVVHPKNSDYLLTLTSYKDLWVSLDNGINWKKIGSSVSSFSWSNSKKEPHAVYATIGTGAMLSMNRFHLPTTYSLRKLKDVTSDDISWMVQLNKVYSFRSAGNFLYATVDYVDTTDFMQRERIMKVSTDGGVIWNTAQLPRITRDRFFSVLDMSEKIVFLHVDNPGDTGHGTLYTSGKDGIIYSVSLKKHLYPNHVAVTDFYRVESMEGVYLASQLSDDRSVHTLITFNRGGSWQPIERPKNAPCKNEELACYLQIHNFFSLSNKVQADPPLSSKNAPGIVLVHGHVADALQTTPPDVFLSRDGGYSWRKVLDGPHKYRIADYGGLIVAVPSTPGESTTLKFTTDEGFCWHKYQFTTEPNFVVTGVLSEPSSASLEVSIWGYIKKNNTWMTFAIEFSKVIKNQCESKDYEDWVPHTLLRKEEGKHVEGCLLGQKTTIQRLKPEAWCNNGLEFKREFKRQPCQCTREDYECDYGYYRPVGDDRCSVIDDFNKPEVDICIRGHEEKIVTEGYRKIPGDICFGGYEPSGNKIDLSVKCKENNFVVNQHKKDEGKTVEKSKLEFTISGDSQPTTPTGIPMFKVSEMLTGLLSKKTNNEAIFDWIESSTIIIIIAMVAAFLTVVMVSYFAMRFLWLKKQKDVYVYSVLSEDENQRNPLLGDKPESHQDSSDEEVLDSKTSDTATDQNGQTRHPALKSYHDDSDDDMLR